MFMIEGLLWFYGAERNSNMSLGCSELWTIEVNWYFYCNIFDYLMSYESKNCFKSYKKCLILKYQQKKIWYILLILYENKVKFWKKLCIYFVVFHQILWTKRIQLISMNKIISNLSF